MSNTPRDCWRDPEPPGPQPVDTNLAEATLLEIVLELSDRYPLLILAGWREAGTKSPWEQPIVMKGASGLLRGLIFEMMEALDNDDEK